MKNITKYIMAGMIGLSGLLADPSVQQAVAHVAGRHKNITDLLLAVGGIAALLHNPKEEQK